MRWGYNWELGIFETWDAIGVEKSVARMKEDGLTIPANVQKLLDSGAKSFTRKRMANSLTSTLLPGNMCRSAISPA